MERDKGVLRSRQRSGTKPVSTFTLQAPDPECSGIIGLEIFTAQQAQTLSIRSSDTCKVYDQWTYTPNQKTLSKKYRSQDFWTALQAILAFMKLKYPIVLFDDPAASHCICFIRGLDLVVFGIFSCSFHGTAVCVCE